MFNINLPGNNKVKKVILIILVIVVIGILLNNARINRESKKIDTNIKVNTTIKDN